MCTPIQDRLSTDIHLSPSRSYIYMNIKAFKVGKRMRRKILIDGRLCEISRRWKVVGSL